MSSGLVGAAAGAAAGAAVPSALGASAALVSGAGAAGAVAAGAGAAGVAAFCSAALSCAWTLPHTLKTPARAINASIRFMAFPLECIRAGFTGTDAHDLFEVENEDLAVADLPGIGGFLDSLDDAVEQVVLDRCLDLDLGQEIDDVFGASIELGVPF